MKKLLIVTHQTHSPNGVKLYVDELTSKFFEKYSCKVVSPCWENVDPFSVSDERSERYFNALNVSQFDSVHFHNLLGWNSFLLPKMSKMAGATTVFFLHDFFLFCPEHRLMDGFSDCGRSGVDDQNEQCLKCVGRSWGERASTELINLRQRTIGEELVPYIDKWIAPSAFMRGFFLSHFPNLECEVVPPVKEKRIGVFPKRTFSERPFPLKVVFIGNFFVEKGAFVFLKLVERLAHRTEFNFSVLGTVPRFFEGLLDELGVHRMGQYTLEDQERLIEKFDLALILSVYRESFGRVLHETRRCGLPSIVSGIGALSEQVTDVGEGILVEPGNVDELIQKLEWVEAHRDWLSSVKPPVCRSSNFHKSYTLSQ